MLGGVTGRPVNPHVAVGPRSGLREPVTIGGIFTPYGGPGHSSCGIPERLRFDGTSPGTDCEIALMCAIIPGATYLLLRSSFFHMDGFCRLAQKQLLVTKTARGVRVSSLCSVRDTDFFRS